MTATIGCWCLFFACAMAHASIVQVRVEATGRCSLSGQCQKILAWGTGTVVAQDGRLVYVLTAGHVLENADSVTVGSQDGWIACDVVAAENSATLDLALLKVRLTDTVRSHRIARSDVTPGERVTVKCMDAERGPRLYTGQVRRSTFSNWPLLIDKTAGTYTSGGAVLTADNVLVGVVWGGKSGFTLFTPASRILHWLKTAGGLRTAEDVAQSRESSPPQHYQRSATTSGQENSTSNPETAQREPAESPPPAGSDTHDQAADPPSVTDTEQHGQPPASADTAPPIRPTLLSATADTALTALPWIFGVGATGGTGALAIWGARLGLAALRRRRSRSIVEAFRERRTEQPLVDREAEKPVVVTTDTPPPPQKIIRETQFAPYERDTFAEAFSWAETQLVRKYPGSVSTLETLKGLIDQFLSSQLETK